MLREIAGRALMLAMFAGIAVCVARELWRLVRSGTAVNRLLHEVSGRDAPGLFLLQFVTLGLLTLGSIAISLSIVVSIVEILIDGNR
jgi:hypothetical protein